jgi:hypothetical protein
MHNSHTAPEVSRGRLALVVLTVAASTLVSTSAAAQGTAAIIGQVIDESGAVLPGVTVTATGPALQVPQVTDATNAQGEYRLAPLPIGTYEVRYDLAGFGSARQQNVRLTVGFTARIDMTLRVASLEESVTVSGAAPVVDVTSTATTTLLTQEMLEAIPTSRNGLMSVMALAPGARTRLEIGSNQMAEDPNARVFGQGGEAFYTLEGMSTQTLGNAASGNFYDYESIDEVRVETLGTDAESPTRGIQVNAIVKSGGNQFHGGARAAYTNQDFQSNNIDDELAAIGITTGNDLLKQYDYSGDVGGRIVANKLWFYGAARRQGVEFRALNAFQPDGSPAALWNDQNWVSGKMTFQASRGNRFITFYSLFRKDEINELDEFTAYEARGGNHGSTRFVKGEWEGVRGNSLIADILVGWRYYDRYDRFNAPSGTIGRSDIVTERIWGQNITAGDSYREDKWHLKGSVAWYKPNWFHGNHEIKAGFDVIPESFTRYEPRRNPNYYLIYSDGAPFRMIAFGSPTFPPAGMHYTGAYVKDSWTIGRRLTVNAGLRYDGNDAFVPETCREAADAPGNVAFPAQCFPKVQLQVWRSLAPRVRLSYDVTGDGRTAIKGGWGRYNHMREAAELTRVNRASIRSAIYTWRDVNGNSDYDPGEVNLDPNGPDFVQTIGRLSLDHARGSTAGGPPKAVANPDWEQPKSDELSISLEHQLASSLAVRVTGVYSRYNNIYRIQNNLRPYEAYTVPITNTDPGPDGRVGSADDGGPFTYYEYAPALAGARFEEFMIVNAPEAGPQTYKSVEVAAVKRLSNRWQLTASYSATRRHRPLISSATVTGFGASVNAGNKDPNAEINRSDDTWDWDAKLTGSYTLPADVTLSGNFKHVSGDPFARTVLFRGGQTIPTLVVNVEPIGSRRLPNVNVLSFRGEKAFRLSGSQRLLLRVDLHNALNANTATGLNSRSGANYLRPTEIMLPRIAELSLGFTF